MAPKPFVTRLYINAENVNKNISQKRKEIRMTTFTFEKCTLTFCAAETRDEEVVLNGELNLMYSDAFLAMDIVTGDGIKKNLEYSGKVQINKKSISCGFEEKRENAATCGLVNVRLENHLLYGYIITVTKNRPTEEESALSACASAADTDFESEGFLFGAERIQSFEEPELEPSCATDSCSDGKYNFAPTRVTAGHSEPVEFVHVSDNENSPSKQQTDLQKKLLENESSIKDLLTHFESFNNQDGGEDPDAHIVPKLLLDEPREKQDAAEKEKDAASVVYRPPTDCTIDLYYKNVFDSPATDGDKNSKHREHRKSKERKHHDREKKGKPHNSSQKRKSTRPSCTKAKKSRENEIIDQKITDEVKTATSALLESQIID